MLASAANPEVVLDDPDLAEARPRVERILEAMAEHNPPEDACLVVRHEVSSGFEDTVVWLREQGTEGTTRTVSGNLDSDGKLWLDGIVHTWHASGEPATERVIGLEDGEMREEILWTRDAEGRVLEQRRVVDKGYGRQRWNETNRYTRDGELRLRQTLVRADGLETTERIRLAWRGGHPVRRRSTWRQTGSPRNRCRSRFDADGYGWTETRRCTFDDVPLIRTIERDEQGHLLLDLQEQHFDDWTSVIRTAWTWDGDRFVSSERFRPILGEVEFAYAWDGDRLTAVEEVGQSHRVVWRWGPDCPNQPLPTPSFEP